MSVPSWQNIECNPAYRPRKLLALIAVLAVTAVAQPTTVSAASQTRAVQFAKGTSAATIKGSVKGYDTMDYTLRAAEGQVMTVSMKAAHPGAFFNVLPPGSKDAAIHIGSAAGNEWTGTLEAAGTYTVRVYLMRNEARRGVQSGFTLNVGIAGGASPSDAKVPGTQFHAKGELECTMGKEAPKMCPFGVIRSGPGRAEVRISPPGGMERTLKFSGNQVTAPGSQSVKATRKGDDWSVEVNDYERYLVIDAVINGG